MSRRAVLDAPDIRVSTTSVSSTEVDQGISVEQTRLDLSCRVLEALDDAICVIGDKDDFARNILGQSSPHRQAHFHDQFSRMLSGDNQQRFSPLLRYLDGDSVAHMQALFEIAGHAMTTACERAIKWSIFLVDKARAKNDNEARYLKRDDILIYVGWCLNILTRWAGHDAAMIKLLSGTTTRADGEQDPTKYTLIACSQLAVQMKTGRIGNFSAEHYIYNAGCKAGFAVLGNPDLLGKTFADGSKDIKLGDETFAFNTSGSADGSNARTLLNLRAKLAEQYRAATKKRRKELTATYHVALSQLLQVSTYEAAAADQDEVTNPQHFGHNAYFHMLLPETLRSKVFPGHDAAVREMAR